MTGKFNLKYFLTGAGMEDWYKALGMGWRLLLVAAIGLTIYKAYFVKTQTQRNMITAQPGSTVIIQQKQEEKKKTWWIPSPFVDLYTFVESNDRKGFGTRFGGRWEF
jgi:hypothetical protein